MDLASSIATNYTLNRGGVSAARPRLTAVPSLKEIALASYIPAFLTEKCAQGSLDRATYLALLDQVPLETPLDQVIGIAEEPFWANRLWAHFKLRSRDSKATYFKRIVEQNIQGETPAAVFEPFTSAENQLNRVAEQFGQIIELQATVAPGFAFWEALRALRPVRVELRFNKKDFSGQSLVQQKREPMRELRGKTLPEIAALDKDSESVFPFHQFYDVQEMQKTAPEYFERTAQTAELSVPYYISPRDILRLGTLLTPQLQELALPNSGLTDDLAAALAPILRNSHLQTLDISNNLITDPAEVLKLCIPGGQCVLKHLCLSRNNIGAPGALSLMKAIKTDNFALQSLLLSGNQLGEHYLLLLNSVLSLAVKSQNKQLTTLDISDCGFTVAIEHTKVFQRILADTAISYLDLSGNSFEEGQEAANQLAREAEAMGRRVLVNAIK